MRTPRLFLGIFVIALIVPLLMEIRPSRHPPCTARPWPWRCGSRAAVLEELASEQPASSKPYVQSGTWTETPGPSTRGSTSCWGTWFIYLLLVLVVFHQYLYHKQMTKVFQYGSNCNAQRLNSPERLNCAAHSLGRAQTVDCFEIAFDVWSTKNKCAAADLIRSGNTPAWGVLYEIPEDYVDGPYSPDRKTLKEIEGPKYEKQCIKVTAKGQTHWAVTFLVKKSERVSGKPTSSAYVCHIVKGLRDHCVPEEYVDRVITAAVDNLASSVKKISAELRKIEAFRMREVS